jgi:peroxiredoxin
MRFSACLATLVVLFASAITQSAQEESLLGRSVASFSLADVSGKTWSLDAVKDKKLVVVCFIGTECPLAKLYAPRLTSLASQYEGQDVAFVVIDSNVQDSLAEMAALARNAKMTFPVLRDVKNRVADQFGASRTPEAFVLDGRHVIRYHGRIDDQYAVGVVKNQPKQTELKMAIDALRNGREPSVAETPLVGCLIGRVRAPQAGAAVTYSKQIARIFNKRCVECHHTGDIAPFPLTSYEDAAGWAAMIDEVIDQGRMPPWHADSKYGTFVGDRRLSDEEKRLVHEWVEAGAPQGEPNETPPVPSFREDGWHYPTPPDMIIPMSLKPFHVKAEGIIRYQRFAVDLGFKEDRWVKAVEVMPGNRSVVHHILVHARVAKDRGQRDGFGGQGFLAAYVPGLRPMRFRNGMAKRIPAGSKFHFQIHYTSNGSEQEDISRVGLWFVDPKEVKFEVKTLAAVNPIFAIPAKAENHPVEALTRGLPRDAQILGFMPHMHLRGKSFSYEAVFPNGKRQMLLDVPRYDFNWQTAYRIERPLTFPSGTRIHAVAHFDNSEQNLNNPDPNAVVFWGEQTYEEMMTGYFDVAIPRSGKWFGNRSDNIMAGFAQLQDEGTKDLVRQFDINKDGKLSRDEIPERLKPIFDDVTGGKDIVPVQQFEAALVKRHRQGFAP